MLVNKNVRGVYEIKHSANSFSLTKQKPYNKISVKYAFFVEDKKLLTQIQFCNTYRVL